ncbi:MAG TPA: hypothetical protein PK659_03660 [Methanothrix sp.]|nr:hypothetical protein [Methanothrix sp.]HOK57935.1 hypothetical protein [Methanothrix sp.]HOL43338.1 hypothetical protein [Methanothrix sp.]HPO88249.1 hypothetical protein [Methanothrix sp.]
MRFIFSSGARSLVALLISAFLVMPASSSWGESIQAELHPGERVEVDGYSIELSDISVVPDNPAALLKIHSNGSISSTVMRAGEFFVLKDAHKREELGIKLEEIRREGYLSNESRATLEIRMRSRPEISISMSPDRDVYHSGDQIRVEVFVENTGDGNAESIRLNLSEHHSYVLNETLKEIGKKMRRSLLRPGEVWMERICFPAPSIPERESIELVAAAEYFDADSNPYRSETVLPITVAGPVELHKRVHEIQTFGRTYYVIDTVRNTGNVRLNLSLTDNAGDAFQSEKVPEQRFDLAPGETKITSYAVKARSPGEGLVLPPARCTYSIAGSTYTVISESPVVDVFGPRIEARRYVSSGGDHDVFKVCMDVKNTGNRYAGVRAHRIFPERVEMLDGKNDLSFALSPGSSRTFCWSIRCPNGSCALPPVDLIYFDSENNIFRCDVPSLRLEKRSPEIPDMSRKNGTERTEVEISEPIRSSDVEPHPSGFALALVLLISALIWVRSL